MGQLQSALSPEQYHGVRSFRVQSLCRAESQSPGGKGDTENLLCLPPVKLQCPKGEQHCSLQPWGVNCTNCASALSLYQLHPQGSAPACGALCHTVLGPAVLIDSPWENWLFFAACPSGNKSKTRTSCCSLISDWSEDADSIKNPERLNLTLPF